NPPAFFVSSIERRVGTNGSGVDINSGDGAPLAHHRRSFDGCMSVVVGGFHRGRPFQGHRARGNHGTPRTVVDYGFISYNEVNDEAGDGSCCGIWSDGAGVRPVLVSTRRSAGGNGAVCRLHAPRVRLAAWPTARTAAPSD